MAKPIKMPKLSDQMTEGRIVEWVKHEGDEVKAGDVLAQVETEKATLDLEAFDSGVLIGVVVKAGDSAPVGQPVAWLGARGEQVPAGAAAASRPAAPTPPAEPAHAPPAAQAAPAHAPAPRPAPSATARDAPDAARDAKAGGEVSRPSAQGAPPRVAQAPERAHDPALSAAPRGRGAGRGGDGEDRPASGSRAAPAHAAPRTAGERVLASPAARKVARERGVDLARVEGSGPGGRIVLSDVEGTGAGEAPPAGDRAPAVLAPGTPPPGTEAPAPAARPPGAGGKARRPLPPRAQLRDETLPLSPMRRAIARNLAVSKPGAPHFYLETSADARRLLGLREQLAELERGPISVNDLVVKAVAEALARHPEVNAAWGADAIVRRGSVDVGVAVALDEGLVTPVVRGADGKDVFALAAELRDLATRARERRLRPEEYQGGSFTVSNLGMFGIEHFFAVINPPEAAILAVGAVMKVPWVDEGSGALVAMDRVRLGLSCDHRVVDGATGARYLQTLKAILEAPVRLVVR
jgi:pyruvate dehydrogenase E2 component (dihydrolipoamide acetyltransferase)